jgi:hypothetical protein
MAVYYCEICCRMIDLDYDVEHYENCPAAEPVESDLNV